jgi:anti-sigma regulatory factor (Ser/Thr protein kinase)
MGGQPFILRIPARPDAVPTARHELAKIAFGYGVDSFAVKTVVSELVGNVVRHAYCGSELGTVLVRAEAGPDCLLITVADDGGGIRPRPKDQRVGLGLGLPLSAQLTEELRVESDGRGTTVFASFLLPARRIRASETGGHDTV